MHMAKQCIKAIHGDDKVYLRAFSDKKDSGQPPVKLEAEPQELDTVLHRLEQLNHQGYGIFFCVNGGGHTDRDITKINAQFVECDSLSIDEQKQQLEAFPLPPSIVIQTRKSLHAYWLLRDGKVEQFRPVQKRLIQHFHGDGACINESRVMRLPGFYHNKQEPVLVKCILFHPERVYTQEELLQVLPERDKLQANKDTPSGDLNSVLNCDVVTTEKEWRSTTYYWKGVSLLN